jgi:hypothetical protein
VRRTRVFKIHASLNQLASAMYPLLLLTHVVFFLLFHTCASLPYRETQNVVSAGKPTADLPTIDLPTSDGLALPVFDSQPVVRAEEIRSDRIGYQYGTPLLGNTSYSPTGPLGDAMVQRDKQQWFRDVQYVTEKLNGNVTEKLNGIEIPRAVNALAKVSLFRSQFIFISLTYFRLEVFEICRASLFCTMGCGSTHLQMVLLRAC